MRVLTRMLKALEEIVKELKILNASKSDSVNFEKDLPAKFKNQNNAFRNGPQ